MCKLEPTKAPPPADDCICHPWAFEPARRSQTGPHHVRTCPRRQEPEPKPPPPPAEYASVADLEPLVGKLLERCMFKLAADQIARGWPAPWWVGCLTPTTDAEREICKARTDERDLPKTPIPPGDYKPLVVPYRQHFEATVRPEKKREPESRPLEGEANVLGHSDTNPAELPPIERSGRWLGMWAPEDWRLTGYKMTPTLAVEIKDLGGGMVDTRTRWVRQDVIEMGRLAIEQIAENLADLTNDEALVRLRLIAAALKGEP